MEEGTVTVRRRRWRRVTGFVLLGLLLLLVLLTAGVEAGWRELGSPAMDACHLPPAETACPLPLASKTPPPSRSDSLLVAPGEHTTAAGLPRPSASTLL